jgi:hypothetical protein
MYVSFVTIGGYDITTYAFHKFESFCIVAALSITISDWSAVLRDIHEYDVSHFFLRRVSLVGINFLYGTISLINFITCFAMKNIDDYVQSYYYLIMIFLQIGVFALLTLLMLHAGNKLYRRISGAAGGNMVGSEAANARQQQPPPGRLGRFAIPAQFFRMTNNGLVDEATSPVNNNINNINNNNNINEQLLRAANPGPPPNSVASSERTTVTSLAPSTVYRDLERERERLPDDRFDLSAGFFSGGSVNSATLSNAMHSSSPMQMRGTEDRATNHFDGTAEFRNALRNLNFVMLACTLCVLLQVSEGADCFRSYQLLIGLVLSVCRLCWKQLLFTILNYALGFANSANESPGPPLLYW